MMAKPDFWWNRAMPTNSRQPSLVSFLVLNCDSGWEMLRNNGFANTTLPTPWRSVTVRCTRMFLPERLENREEKNTLLQKQERRNDRDGGVAGNICADSDSGQAGVLHHHPGIE